MDQRNRRHTDGNYEAPDKMSEVLGAAARYRDWELHGWEKRGEPAPEKPFEFRGTDNGEFKNRVIQVMLDQGYADIVETRQSGSEIIVGAVEKAVGKVLNGFASARERLSTNGLDGKVLTGLLSSFLAATRGVVEASEVVLEKKQTSGKGHHDHLEHSEQLEVPDLSVLAMALNNRHVEVVVDQLRMIHEYLAKGQDGVLEFNKKSMRELVKSVFQRQKKEEEFEMSWDLTPFDGHYHVARLPIEFDRKYSSREMPAIKKISFNVGRSYDPNDVDPRDAVFKERVNAMMKAYEGE